MNFGGTLRINKFACFTFTLLLFLIIYWRSGGSSDPIVKDDLINLKDLLKAAIHATERGGQKVIEGKDRALNVRSKGKTLEGANDPVTDADYASHCAMYYGLKNTFPKLTIVSEEKEKDEKTCSDQPRLEIESLPIDHRAIEYMNDEHVFVKDITLWIDPLDATQEYTEGLYQYVTTMACVAIKGVPIIGVIHFPFPPRTYWGWYTKKTSSNIPNVVHKLENREHPRVVVSRSHTGTAESVAKKVFGSKAKVTEAGGAGYKIMGVINGTYDVYLHMSVIKKWDICAATALIRTVNGELTTSVGEIINFSTESGVKVNDGVLAARFDHDYYMKSVQEEQRKMKQVEKEHDVKKL